MRNRLFLCLVAAAGLIAASAAQAGTLTMASWSQVTQGVPIDRTLTELNASGTSTASSIAVNLTFPFFSFTTFVPKTANGLLDLHIKITQGGPQAITATAGMAGVDIGIPGTVVVMTANHVAKGANASMFNVGVNTLVAVPVNIGEAGVFTGGFIVLGVTHTITVDFFAWTPGMQTFTGLTSGGEALPSVMAQGSFMLTGTGNGTVTLVSPSKVSINGALAQRRTAAFTTLKLTFDGAVPEPGTLLLLGAGVLGLALVGSRKR